MASTIPGNRGTVQLNKAGIRDLLKSPAIQSELVSRMRRVQSALPGSELTVTTTPTRARVKVARGSDFDEANTGDLSRALSLSGGLRGTRVKGMAKPSRRAKT